MRDYESTYASYTWPRPAGYNFARDVIDQWGARAPSLRAMRWVDDDGNQLDRTFAEMSTQSKRAANLLSTAGVQRGDTVLVILGRQIAWWEVVTACIRGGFVVAPGTAQLSPKDIAYRIGASSATAIVADEVNAVKVDAVAAAFPNLKARIIVGATRDGWLPYELSMAASEDTFEAADTALEETALLYFTSGTTGLPKIVEHSHGYTLAHETTGRYWLNLASGDLHWNISDTGWAKAAWSSYFGPWHQGASVFVHHTNGFSAKAVLRVLQEHPISTLCGFST